MRSAWPFTNWKWRCNACLCINSIYDWTRHDCFEFSRNMSAVLSCHNFADWFEVADIDVPTIRLRKGDASGSIRKLFSVKSITWHRKEFVDWFDAFVLFVIQDEEVNELTSEVNGPWMKRWEIVHHNRHTESMVDGTTSWHKA